MFPKIPNGRNHGTNYEKKDYGYVFQIVNFEKISNNFDS